MNSVFLPLVKIDGTFFDADNDPKMNDKKPKKGGCREHSAAFHSENEGSHKNKNSTEVCGFIGNLSG
jgi:hypothetical protein